jgi:hypothetical protein
MGTNDVDLLVAFHVDDTVGAQQEEPDLSALENALKSAQFQRDPKIDGWRWIATVDRQSVRVEFLCDRNDVPSNRSVTPRGCNDLHFANLRGTGYVARDFTEERVTDRLPDGNSVEVRVRFAGLQGYLLAKIAALVDRRLDKDHYDLVYVLLHHKAGTGPRGAAAALRSGPFRDELPALRNRFREVATAFATSQDLGPIAYAKQYSQVYPDSDSATLMQDAIGAVNDFVSPLIAR